MTRRLLLAQQLILAATTVVHSAAATTSPAPPPSSGPSTMYMYNVDDDDAAAANNLGGDGSIWALKTDDRVRGAADMLQEVSFGDGATHLMKVKAYLESGVPADYVDPGGRLTAQGMTAGGMTALIIATHHGHSGMIDLLLKHGANVNQRSAGNNEMTPLIMAVVNGHLMCARVLLAA